MLAAVERIEIGDHVMFANHCFVGDADHRYDDPDMPDHLAGVHAARAGEDRVERLVRGQLRGHGRGDDRRAGGNRANSVVTRDIPPGVIAAGAPAKVIREIEFKQTA